MKLLSVLCACSFVLAFRAGALEYYVDNTVGDDKFSGTSKTVAENKVGPFRSITKAVLAAKAGDTVLVIPTGKPYRETVNLYGMKNGEPGKPITIDGQGVTVSGAEECPPAGWRIWKDDVVMRDDFPWKAAGGSYTPFSVVFVVDGKLQLETTACDVLQPGEFCYIPLASNRLFYRPKDKTVPEIEVGQPDGAAVNLDNKAWQSSGMNSILRYNGLKAPTWVKCNGADVPLITAMERLEPGQFTVAGKMLYYRLPKGKTAAGLRTEAVVRDNGVQLGGSTSHVIIKNFNVSHVSNDGYNIHGAAKHIEFYNCNATHCGDEGFSSHETCETLLDGAVYAYCDNGITNVTESVSVTKNVICAYSRHTGYEMQQQSKHTLENIILLDNPGQLGGTGKVMKADNVLIVRTSPGAPSQAINLAGAVELSRFTVAGNSALLRYMGGTGFSMDRCLFAAGQGGIHVRQDDVVTPFALKKVRFGEDSKMEYGGRPPFKIQTVKQWLSTLAEAGKVQDAAIEETAWAAAIVNGKVPSSLPEGIGCSKELLARFCDFITGKH
ncbi:MAG: right-handed parallel beta-helix repeat-containing protein [Victivallales bacterium]|jgi:hypothetical protein